MDMVQDIETKLHAKLFELDEICESIKILFPEHDELVKQVSGKLYGDIRTLSVIIGRPV